MIKPYLKPLGIALFVLLFGLVVWANRTGHLDPRPYKDKGTLLPVTGDTTFPPQTIPIRCGIDVQKMYDFSVQSETFSAEGWVWLVWPAAFQDLLTARGIPVDRILTTVNTTQAASVSLTPDETRQLPDGQTYQLYRFSGKFYATSLDFRHFPFEAINVPLIFGLNPENSALSVAHARLFADPAHSGLGQYTDIPGYVNTGQFLRELTYQYGVRFGLPVDPTDARFSRIEMNIVYHTAATASILQLVLPLFVVMTILLLAPNLTGSLWNVRTAIPPSILLALIFQEQAYRAKLPSLPYLTFMDQMYASCFAVALIVFGFFVWTSNLLDQSTPENRAEVVARINRIDFRFQIGLACGLALIVCLAWFFPCPLR